MNIYVRIFCCVALLFLSSCKKDNSSVATPADPSIFVSVGYVAGQEALLTDTLKYTNNAGNRYGVWRLEYYLSRFFFQDMHGAWINAGTECYVNAKTPGTNFINLGKLPQGPYQRVRFCIGLPGERNISGCMGTMAEHLNMAWPDMMGGGYHFLMMEGYFMDSMNIKQGFAMHVGKTENLVTVEMPFSCNHTANDTMRLQMDINEWFCNPFTYDFNKCGNYTMGVDSLMNKLKQNGADVFKIIP